MKNFLSAFLLLFFVASCGSTGNYFVYESHMVEPLPPLSAEQSPQYLISDFFTDAREAHEKQLEDMGYTRSGTIHGHPAFKAPANRRKIDAEARKNGVQYMIVDPQYLLAHCYVKSL